MLKSCRYFPSSDPQGATDRGSCRKTLSSLRTWRCTTSRKLGISMYKIDRNFQSLYKNLSPKIILGVLLLHSGGQWSDTDFFYALLLIKCLKTILKILCYLNTSRILQVCWVRAAITMNLFKLWLIWFNHDLSHLIENCSFWTQEWRLPFTLLTHMEDLIWKSSF